MVSNCGACHAGNDPSLSVEGQASSNLGDDDPDVSLQATLQHLSFDEQDQNTVLEGYIVPGPDGIASMPPGGALSDADLEIVLDWIASR